LAEQEKGIILSCPRTVLENLALSLLRTKENIKYETSRRQMKDKKDVKINSRR